MRAARTLALCLALVACSEEARVDTFEGRGANPARESGDGASEDAAIKRRRVASAAPGDVVQDPAARRAQEIDEWVGMLQDHGYSGDMKGRAVDALVEIGADALPALMAAAEASENWERPLVALRRFGADALPFAPRVAALLEHRVKGEVAPMVLAAMGVEALPYVIERLGSENVFARRHAATAIEIADRTTRDAVVALSVALGDPDAEVRQIAALALRRQPLAPDVAIPALTAALRDQDADVRRSAVRALGAYDTAAADAAAALRSALSGEPEIRAAALIALGELAPHLGADRAATTRAVLDVVRTHGAEAADRAGTTLRRLGADALLTALTDESPELRRLGAAELADLAREGGADEPRVTARLEAALWDADEQVAISAAHALAGFGQRSSAAARILLAETRSASGEARAAGARDLARVASGDAAVARLSELLSDASGRVRIAALRALEEIGPAASAAASELLRVAETGRDTDRWAAIDALAGLGPAAGDDAVVRLRRILAIGKMRTRVHATVALSVLEPDGASSRTSLEQLKVENPRWVRIELVALLGRFPTPLGLPVVAGRLSDGDAAVRAAAALSLGRFGALARPHVKDLATRVSDDHVTVVRVAGAQALGALGALASDAIPALEAAVAEGPEELRVAARSALEAIR